jgi:hypothetical protein
MNTRKETKQKSANLYWNRFHLLPSVDVTGFQATEAYSGLELTRVKYNLYSYSKDEKEKVTLLAILKKSFFFRATAPIWALAYLHETLRFTSEKNYFIEERYGRHDYGIMFRIQYTPWSLIKKKTKLRGF